MTRVCHSSLAVAAVRVGGLELCRQRQSGEGKSAFFTKTTQHQRLSYQQADTPAGQQVLNVETNLRLA